MRINPKYVGIGLAVVFLLLAFGFTIRGCKSSTSTPPTDSRPSVTPSTVSQTAGSTPATPEMSDATLRRSVKRFVSLYFSFNPRYCNSVTWKDQLSPYVTEAFLSGVNLGDCSAGPQAAMLHEGATSAATLVGDPVISAKTDGLVYVTAEIRTTKFDSTGRPDGSVPFIQAMVWQYKDNTWRVMTFD